MYGESNLRATLRIPDDRLNASFRNQIELHRHPARNPRMFTFANPCSLPDNLQPRQFRAQLHSKENRNKEPIINDLSRYSLQNQSVFRKNVKFSATQTLEMFNLKQPKPPPQVVSMVRVAKNHNLLIERFACFVTI